MATPNGDVQIETAESFARDYLDDLFNNNKNLGAFEEETLDINIKSKYDDIDVEEEGEEKNESESVPTSENIAAYSMEAPSSSSVVESDNAEGPLEPGQLTVQVNGHAVEVKEEKEEAAVQNGNIEGDVIEPGHREFTEQSSEHSLVEQVSTLSIQADEPLEPGNTTFQTAQEVVAEEAEVQVTNEDEVVPPVPMSRSKPTKASDDEEDEDAVAEMQFKRIGLSKNWWDSKRTETENTKEPGKPVDKFKTIKQNIKRGNTRSLLERFENMSKVAE